MPKEDQGWFPLIGPLPEQEAFTNEKRAMLLLARHYFIFPSTGFTGCFFTPQLRHKNKSIAEGDLRWSATAYVRNSFPTPQKIIVFADDIQLSIYTRLEHPHADYLEKAHTLTLLYF